MAFNESLPNTYSLYFTHYARVGAFLKIKVIIRRIYPKVLLVHSSFLSNVPEWDGLNKAVSRNQFANSTPIIIPYLRGCHHQTKGTDL